MYEVHGGCFTPSGAGDAIHTAVLLLYQVSACGFAGSAVYISRVSTLAPSPRRCVLSRKIKQNLGLKFSLSSDKKRQTARAEGRPVGQLKFEPFSFQLSYTFH